MRVPVPSYQPPCRHFFELFRFLKIFVGLNSGLHACKAGAQLFEPHLQFIFALVILEMGVWVGLMNYLPRLALNHYPPNSQPPK
jgi:hypothetical protein